MRALGNYILRNRLQAMGVISFFTILSLLLPTFAYLLSGVPVALVTLRRGGIIGIQVILGSILLTLVLILLFKLNPYIVLAFALAIWLPIWLCSMLLRFSESQGLLVLISGFLGMLFVIIMYILLDDVSGWWESWLELWIDNYLPPDIGEQYKRLFALALPLMNAMVASKTMYV